MPPKKRIIRVNSTDDDVHLVVKEKGLGKNNKSIQASRKEAWSADLSDSRTRPTHWQFNKRNVHTNEKIPIHSDSEDLNGEINGHVKSKHLHEDSTLRVTGGPNVIYSREVQNKHYNRKERDIYLEDYDGEYTPRSYRKRMPNDESETESLRRHEIERGSDRDYRRMELEESGSFRKNFRRQHATVEDETEGGVILQDGREQLFIREGNTEILRLLTRGRPEEERGNERLPQRPVTFVREPQYILVDSGKNILMQRFIEQQLLQQQEHQSHSNQGSIILPNELVGSRKGSQNSIHSTAESKRTTYNIHQELLETSLRQQNELLRQILLEKEKMDKKYELIQQEEARLETQSLPGHSVIATQTDCNTATQTEPQYLRPPRRQIRSDNDDSLSDDEDFHLYIIKQTNDANGVRWVKKRKKLKRRRFNELSRGDKRVVAEVRRNIKTPILEESESPLEITEKRKNGVQYKIRVLRKLPNEELSDHEEEQLQKEGETRKACLKKDVLLEISNSLDKEETKKTPSKCKKIILYDTNSEDDKKTYKIKKDKVTELISDDSLDYEDEDVVSENVKKNSLASYQGSSSDAKEGIEHTYSNEHSSEHYRTSQEEERNQRNLQHQNTFIVDNDHENTKSEKKKDATKSTPRYMQWYNKKDSKDNNKQKDHKEKENIKKTKKSSNKSTKSLLADTKSSSIKKVFPTEKKNDDDDEVSSKKCSKASKTSNGEATKENGIDSKSNYPLVQHSEYRFEHPSQITSQMFPQQIYMNTTPVGIPAPVVTLIPSNLASQLTSQQITVQPNNIQQSERNKTPEKPPRPNLKKSQEANNKTQTTLLKAPGGIEEDYDSGIAMASLQNVKRANQMTEKKSIFTIAYDDMHTKQLLPDSSSPPY